MKHALHYLLAVAVVILAWAAVSWALMAVRGREILPSPSATAVAAWENLGVLAAAFGTSALRFFVALVVAFALGLPLGLAVGFERALDTYLSPLIYLLYPIPPVALLLFLYLAFGLGEVVRLVVVVAALFFQVVVAAQGAAKYISPSHVTAVRSAGASRWQLYRHVVLPATLPSVLTAARVSVGLGITLLYIAETKLGVLLGPRSGLGRLIEYYTFRADIALAGVMALALLGLLFYVLLEFLERRLCRWKYIGGQGGA
ncbi:MAG: ABC transporter permease subunit [Candidatus Acetothermia bacterium]|jgi:NitT/TauT family transport system permease protein|nr:ABC transporter permease subunit [Candidatus Acetothermia bacterium]